MIQDYKYVIKPPKRVKFTFNLTAFLTTITVIAMWTWAAYMILDLPEEYQHSERCNVEIGEGG